MPKTQSSRPKPFIILKVKNAILKAKDTAIKAKAIILNAKDAIRKAKDTADKAKAIILKAKNTRPRGDSTLSALQESVDEIKDSTSNTIEEAWPWHKRSVQLSTDFQS